MKNNDLVLLVDNNIVSNFFNKKVIEETNLAKKVVTLANAKEALDFVNPKKSLEPYPSLIFIDLHMPVMNGWEFLEAYNDIDSKSQCAVVVMYEKELLPEEEMRLSQYSFVKSTTNKILNNIELSHILSDTNVTETLKYS